MAEKLIRKKPNFHVSDPLHPEPIAKRTGMQLRDREQLFLTIFEKAPIGINQVSPDGKSIRANLAFRHFLGYTDKEMRGRLFTEWTHPDDVALSALLVQQFHSGECDSRSFERRYIRKDGKIVWGHTTVTAIRDERGNIGYVIEIVDDITNRKKTDELLKSTNELLLEINKVRGLSKTLRHCLETAIRISEMDCGGIYLLDDQGGLKLSESKGLSEKFLDGACYYSAEAPNTRLVMAGKPIYARHSDLDVTLTGPDMGEAIKTFAAFPIYNENTIIGCLNVASHTMDEVPGCNRRSLEAVTTVIGLLISRAQAGESIQESESLFQMVFDCSRDAKFIIDQKGRFIKVNKAAAGLTGCTIDELPNMSMFDFYNTSDQSRIRSCFQRVMDGEDMLVDFKIRRKDGAEIDTEFSNTRIQIDGELHMHATARDVTERKRLERKLRNSVALLENIHACLDEAVFVVDPRTRTIISANEAAGKIFGYQVKEMIGRKTEFMHVSREKYQEFGRLIAPSMAAEKIFRTEFCMRKKDGTIFPTENTIKEVPDDSGRSGMHVSVVRDITEQKKAIGTLENREKDLREKSVHLEELNVALKVLLDQREKEKKKIEESFSSSISELIIPYLERIRKTGLNELQIEYINMLESNLREIIQPYKHRISDKLTRLSPSETRIVNCIRQGYGSKEIASMLNISLRTVEFHRDNIRKKLGLKNRKVNLRTYLAGLP